MISNIWDIRFFKTGPAPFLILKCNNFERYNTFIKKFHCAYDMI